MELHEELRSLELGNHTIAEYFKKIKVTTDLLANINSTVEDRNLVMYAVYGLDDRYEHVASIIRHSKQPLTLLETSWMLLPKESHMNRKHQRNGSRDTTSLPTVLGATNNNLRNNNNMPVCCNFQKGACNFDRCRYLHVDSNGNRHSGMNTARGSTQQWNNMGSRTIVCVNRNHNWGCSGHLWAIR